MSSVTTSAAHQQTTDRSISEDLPLNVRRFSVEEYYKMAEAGVLGPEERVELIEGEIIVMSPRNPAHAASHTRAARLFGKRLGERAVVRVQAPIHLDRSSEPEPDLVLALPDENDYGDHHPVPAEILLVMEISESTLAFDRLRKSRLYAKAGIVQYCLLNLQARELEDYRQPGKDGYRSKQTYTSEESFSLAAFPEILIEVDDLLPPVAAPKKARRRRK